MWKLKNRASPTSHHCPSALCGGRSGYRTRVPSTFHGHSIKSEKVFRQLSLGKLSLNSFIRLQLFPVFCFSARFLTLCVSKLPNFVPFSLPFWGFPLAGLSTHYLREKECSWKLLGATGGTEARPRGEGKSRDANNNTQRADGRKVEKEDCGRSEKLGENGENGEQSWPRALVAGWVKSNNLTFQHILQFTELNKETLSSQTHAHTGTHTHAD